MLQLLLHLIGDYVTQSEWMAVNKTKATWPAIVHATVYSLPFFLIGSVTAVLVIWTTHLIIDRFRLARFIVYSRNLMSPPSSWKPWKECSVTGSHQNTSPSMSLWLLIAADNALHLTINYLALLHL